MLDKKAHNSFDHRTSSHVEPSLLKFYNKMDVQLQDRKSVPTTSQCPWKLRTSPPVNIRLDCCQSQDIRRLRLPRSEEMFGSEHRRPEPLPTFVHPVMMSTTLPKIDWGLKKRKERMMKKLSLTTTGRSTPGLSLVRSVQYVNRNGKVYYKWYRTVSS